ncbi:hypothetical protein MTO96_051688 [Rhipicephalus appendiculatus]
MPSRLTHLVRCVLLFLLEKSFDDDEVSAPGSFHSSSSDCRRRPLTHDVDDDGTPRPKYNAVPWALPKAVQYCQALVHGLRLGLRVASRTRDYVPA